MATFRMTTVMGGEVNLGPQDGQRAGNSGGAPRIRSSAGIRETPALRRFSLIDRELYHADSH